MGKGIKIKFFISFLLIPATAYTQQEPGLRNQIIEETLFVKEIEAGYSSAKQVSPSAPQNLPPSYNSILDKVIGREGDNLAQAGQKRPHRIMVFNAVPLDITLGANSGYLMGNSIYNFNHHTSELEFPMNNWMAGANLSFRSENLSLNSEFWLPLDDNAGFHMKDKDWNSDGKLYSYTKSRAIMDAIIGDANVRYDFYNRINAETESRIGFLLGYKYERFDYDIYDLYYDTDTLGGRQGQTLYPGEKVLTYWVKYYLPYIGAVLDLSRQKWGISMNVKYSGKFAFKPAAKDLDNHLLRGLTFFGDYDKDGEVLITGIHVFWKFLGGWKLKLGMDGTFARIDGTTHEDKGDPVWYKDQSIKTKQELFWSGIEYTF